MLHYIEKLQKKPPHTRKQVAVLIASGVTLLVALIWFSTLGAKFSNHEEAAGDNSTSPLKIIREQMSDFGALFKGKLNYLHENNRVEEEKNIE